MDAKEVVAKVFAAAEVVRSLVMNDPPAPIDQLADVQEARQEQRQAVASGDTATVVAAGPQRVQEPPDSKKWKTCSCGNRFVFGATCVACFVLSCRQRYPRK